MGYARHIGRVGALAVALGVGVGLGYSPGLAAADDPDSTSASPADPGPAAPSTAVDGAALGVAPNPPHSPDSPAEPSSNPAATVDPRDGIVQAGGGAIVRSTTEAEPTPTPAPDPQPHPEPDPKPPTVVAEPSPEPPAPPEVAKVFEVAMAKDDHHAVTVATTSSESTATEQNSTAAVESSATGDSASSPSTPALITTLPVAAPTTFAARATSNTLDLTPPAALVAPTPSLGQLLLQPLTTLVSGILGAFGLGPVVLPPGSSMTPFPLLELAFAVFRRIESTLSNATPSATYTVGTPSATGTVSGRIVGTDPDGDALTYILASGPSRGQVDLRTDGTFTYMSTDPSWAQTGEPDQFTVTVSDATNFHVHPAGTMHATQLTVDIDGPPAAPDLGQVTGHVEIPNPNGVPLSYAVTNDPAGGTVTVDPAGNYAYTPTYAARHRAASDSATPDDQVYEFQVRATGEGVDTTVTVTAPISPANEDPVTIESPTQTTNPADGRVTGTITATDADGDPLAYQLDYDTTQGALAYNPATGVYTYTPTDEARHAAAATPATSFAPSAAMRSLAALDAADPTIATLTFTFTDGYGGITTQTVSVPISPLNSDPEVTSTIVAVDPTTRVASGTLTATDADGDPVSYTASGATHGDVSFVDGTWTYTPTSAALHDAARVNATTAATTDSFTLSIDDGHGGVVDVPVNVSLLSPITAGSAVVQQIPAGNGPYFVTVGADGRYVYVSDVFSSTLGVLDTSTGNVTYLQTAAPVGRSVLAANGTRLVAENGSNSTVTVVDTTTNTVIATIAVGGYADDIVADQAGNRVYVFVARPDDTYDLAVIDTTTNAVTNRVHLGDVADLPVLSSDGSKLYFRDYQTSAVKVVDTDTLAITDLVGNGTLDGVTVIALNPDGTQLYASTYEDLYVFDTASGNQQQVLPNIGNGQFIVFSPDGAKAYTSNSNGSALSVIDTTTFVVNDVAIGPSPINAIVSPDGRQVFTLNQDGTVSVVDTASLTSGVIDVHAAQYGLYQVALSPDGRHLYLPQLEADALTVVSASTVNAAPSVNFSQHADAGSGGVVYTVIGEDGDADQLTVTATPLVTGTLSDLGGGSFLFVPNTSQIGHLPAGVNDVIAFTVSDGHGGSSSVLGTYDVAPTPEATVVNSYDFDGEVRNVALSPDGTTAYVSVLSYTTPSRTVVIDTATGTVLGMLPYGSQLQDAVSLNADGTRLLVNEGGSFHVVDTTDSYQEVVSINGNADYAELSADGLKVYALANGELSVYDVDPDSETFGTTIATIPTGGYATSITRGVDGVIYFSTSDFVVTAIDPTTDTAIGSVLATSGAYNISAAPHRIYATLYGTSLTIIDTDTDSVTANLPLRVESGGPYVTANADGSRLYLSRFDEGLLSVYDTATNTIVGTVRLGAPGEGGDDVFAAAVSADGSLVVVPVGNAIKVVSTGRTITV